VNVKIYAYQELYTSKIALYYRNTFAQVTRPDRGTISWNSLGETINLHECGCSAVDRCRVDRPSLHLVRVLALVVLVAVRGASELAQDGGGHL
jgi:hypothetical protein